MKTIKYFLRNQCDEYAGSKPRRFRVCAYILHLMGCNYWYDSKDYQWSKQA
jgi:hypothetical protein